MVQCISIAFCERMRRMNVRKESACLVMLAALIMSNSNSLCLQKGDYLHVI